MSDKISDQQTQRELAVLQRLQQQADSPQRDIARHTGMSLGLTNAVLKRLVHKGYVTMRKVKGRHMAYAVTPDGVSEIARRSYRYFRRTMEHVGRYRDAVNALVAHAAGAGYTALELRGRSDIDFLVEHACGAHGLEYAQREAPPDGGGRCPGTTFVVVGEREAREGRATAHHLWDYILDYEAGGSPEVS